MKIILLWVVMLLPVLGVAQTTVTVNRVIVKDSLSLDGKWIKRINNDSTLITAGEQSVSTDAAIKRYVDKVAAGGGMSYEERAKALLNPNYLEVWFIYYSRPATDTSTKFTINIESSDGVKTSYGISGISPFDIFYGYGKPPFTVSTAIKNTTVDSMLTLGVDGTNKFLKYYYSENNSIPGETIKLQATGLKGIVSMILNTNKISEGKTNLKVHEKITNHSAHHVLKCSRYVGGNIWVLPGKIEEHDYFWDKDLSFGMSAEANHVSINNMGDYVIGQGTSSSLRLKIYKNGQFFKEEIFPALSAIQKGFSMDTSWTDCELILEDL